MFVVFGTKVTSKPLGWVADYCIICRGIRRCELFAVLERSHLYYLSLGSGRLLGHRTRCEECRTVCPVDAGIFRSISPFPADQEALIEETQADVRDRYAKELALNDASSPPDPQTRLDLIMAPFVILAPLVEERYGATHLDRYSVSVLLAMVVGVVVIFLVGTWGREPGQSPPDLPWKLIGYAYLTAGAIFFALLATDPRRYVRREIITRLARSLRPLDPLPDEIQNVLRHLRTLRLKIGRKVAPRRLVGAMSDAKPI